LPQFISTLPSATRGTAFFLGCNDIVGAGPAVHKYWPHEKQAAQENIVAASSK
jgi:hypothetical protein